MKNKVPQFNPQDLVKIKNGVIKPKTSIDKSAVLAPPVPKPKTP